MTARISGTTNTLNFVTWTGSQVLAVGENGAICTSPNGTIWVPGNSGRNDYLSCVVWTGRQFVAVGIGGWIFTSPDGVLWTPVFVEGAGRLYSVTWTGALVVAVGGAGAVFTSPDGINWTARSSGSTQALSSVTWMDKQLVAVGIGGTVLTSPDGIDWTGRVSGTTRNLHSVTWRGSLAGSGIGQLIAVGGWVDGGGGGAIITSPDGITWTARISGTIDWLYAATWTGHQFVAVGENGTILVSQDGLIWTYKNSGTTQTLYSVTWTGSQVVAVGQVGAVVSFPDDSPEAAPHSSSQNGMLLRVTQTDLCFTPPTSLLNQKMTMTIYALTGRKGAVRQSAYISTAGEFLLPIKDLKRGAYLFELKGERERLARTFSITK